MCTVSQLGYTRFLSSGPSQKAGTIIVPMVQLRNGDILRFVTELKEPGLGLTSGLSASKTPHCFKAATMPTQLQRAEAGESLGSPHPDLGLFPVLPCLAFGHPSVRSCRRGVYEAPPGTGHCPRHAPHIHLFNYPCLPRARALFVALFTV